MKCVGIDLGTSLSSASIIEDGKPTALRIDTAVSSLIGDSYSIPSSVFVEENGDILIGQAADNSRLRDPGRYRKEFKRDLGTKVPYQIGQKDMVPEELYKVFLKYLKVKADERVGKKVGKIVITHPANFTAFKKDLIKQAALMAGFIEVVLIDEPTAAAIYYSSREKIEVGQRLLVYDLGGGTFDLSIIVREEDGFRPLTAPLGLERCGGVDFQNKIYRDIVETFKDTIGPIIKKRDINARRIISYLEEESIKIKHHLSVAREASELIFFPGIIEKEYKLTRERFQEMIGEEISNSCELIKLIIKNANLTMGDIDRVLLVGGSSRIPFVEEMVSKTIDAPIYKNADPELVISLGAAIYGSIGLKNEDEEETDDKQDGGTVHEVREEDIRVDLLEANFEDLILNHFKSECAYILNCQGDKRCVVWRGERGESYDFISELRLFSNGEKLIYRGQLGNKAVVVVNGVQSPLYDWLGEVEFSPDQRRCCVKAEKDGQQLYLIDGVEEKAFSRVSDFKFSEDGSHYAYKADIEGKQMIVQDGKAGERFDLAGSLFLTKEGRGIYSSRLEDCWYVVSGEVKSEPFNEIGEIELLEEGKVLYSARSGNSWYIISTEGKTGEFEEIKHLNPFIYAVKTNEMWRYVREGIPGQMFEWVGPCVLAGSHYAYRAYKYGKYLVIVDGRAGESCDWASQPLFSPGGTSTLYMVNNDNRWQVVSDGRYSDIFDDINNLGFSPDGRRTVFTARLGGKSFAVVDGMRGEAFDSVGAPVFSPDGKRLAYRGKDGGKWYLIVDGMRSEGFDAILFNEFSRDSLHIMCRVKSQDKELLLIDGKIYASFDEIYDPGFDEGGKYARYYYRNSREVRYRQERII